MLGRILFMAAAVVIAPLLLLGLWAHAVTLEMWKRVRRRMRERPLFRDKAHE
jgi:hypothetical protein